MFNYIYKLHNKNIRKGSIYHYYRAFLVISFIKIIPQYFSITSDLKSNKLNNKSNSNDFIVSLTTFPNRIDKIWLVIESILRQNIKPDRIILWLYKGEFKDLNSLPKNLLKLKKRGLEIRFCSENLKPHKKYFYTLLEFPESNIITVDDDFIYPPNLIKNLIESHKTYPKAIICSMTRVIRQSNNQILPYKEWKRPCKNLKPNFNLLTMGGGGTLFPPGSLHPEVVNIDNLKRLAITADDLWLKVMSLRNKTRVVSLEGEYPRPFFQVNIENDIRLADTNLREGQNDAVFHKLLEYYKLPISIFEN